jgi:hypothetical protein
MAESHSMNQKTREEASSTGGWTPSRGFWIGMFGVAAFAAVLTFAGAIAAVREPEPAPQAETTPEPVRLTVEPRKTTPADDITRGAWEAVPVFAGASVPDAGTSVAEAGSEPGTVISAWSMDPLPEDGDTFVAASSTSMSPVVMEESPEAVLALPD